MHILDLFPHLQALRLESTTLDGSVILFPFAPASTAAACPRCGHLSPHLHPHYQRLVADLPVSGRSVRLAIQVGRFRCLTSPCPRRIFAERLPSLVAPFARKTQGLRQALEQIGFANGGEAGARLAAHLGMTASPATLLRVIRAAPCPDPGSRPALASMTGCTNGGSAMVRPSAI
jgi:hypothetical protein